MPKHKKKAFEMTTDELARRVFPKKVAEELKRIAHAEPPSKKPRAKPNQPSQD